MAEIIGENSVPLGVAGTGSAYILGNRTPNALAVLMQGQRARDLAAQRAAAAKLKSDQAAAKEYNDRVKFDQSGSPYFATPLAQQVYGPTMDNLKGAYKNNQNDAFARNLEVAPILQRAENETRQAEGKTKYIDTQLRAIQADKALYNPQYAGQHLASALRREDGAGRLPSEFDEELWHNSLLADPNLYNENEVMARAAKRIGHEVSQKVAEAGSLGGQHTADQVRAKYVRLQNGKPVLNADGSPALALTPDLQAAFESDPLVKMQIDRREAEYEKQREADPSLPKMTRRGHLAKVVAPFAYYSTSEDEGLNPLPRAPRERKPTDIVATPTVTGQTSFYQANGTTTTQPNHYAAVGHAFGSQAKPYVEVDVNNNDLEVIGKDGRATHLNKAGTNGRAQVQLEGRDYVLFADGKRLGRSEPYQTDEEARRHVLQLIKDSPHPERLQLRVMGRGVVVDKTKVAGDGLGGNPPAPIFNPSTGKYSTDNSTTETRHTVTFPITQDVDATLKRATRGAWNHYKISDAEREVMRALKARGGHVVTPYNPAPTTPARSTSKTKPTRPSFLGTKTTAPKAPTTPRPAADKSGGML